MDRESSSFDKSSYSSDYDFSDIFGGPPRRSSSIHEKRCSSSRSMNSGDIDLQHSPASGSNRKAETAFGDQSANCVDFFHDIFRGDESSRSRRTSYRGQRSSDHFATSITTPQSSLGAKSNKSLELPPSRLSIQSDKIAGMSLLSKSAIKELRTNSEEDPKSPDTPINSNPFHLSTYSWSCRRGPMVMPLHGTDGLKSKDRIKLEKCSSSDGSMGKGKDGNNSMVRENGWKENKGKMTQLWDSKIVKKVDEGKKCSTKPEVKGNIEEFVKILNMEASLKPTIDQSRSQSCKQEETAPCKASPNTSKASSMVDKHVEKPPADTTMDDLDDSSEIEFLIEELSNEHHEAIQASDAKIQRWREGKEGNIRSLLSTLQYVLWDESGWKPVALVDIIEGSAVKKAYQRALLCLHPDKLQQKGAAAHKKYIAQVVFDILQEAWDLFNLKGPL